MNCRVKETPPDADRPPISPIFCADSGHCPTRAVRSLLGADSQRVVFLACERAVVYIPPKSSHYLCGVSVALFLQPAGSLIPRCTPPHHRPSDVRVMGMMVFDRRTCTWRAWHGTRAIWLKLPHAVVTAVCVASTAALRSAAPLPAHPVERVLSLTAPPPAVGTSAPVTQALGTPMPAAAFLPSPWFFAPTSGADGSGTSPSPTPPIGRSPFTPNLPIIPATPIVPPARVPEPRSLTVLAGAVLALAAVRRRHFPRWVRKEAPNQ